MLTRIAALLAVVAIWPAAATAEERVALLIGNSAYGDLGYLPNPVNDVDLMARTVEDLGFEVLVHKDADQKTMKRAIQEFGRRLQAGGDDAVGLFFYAGHGVQVQGSNYLIPVNAAIETESDVEIEAVNANWVLGKMEEAGNPLNFMILDACRNNPLARSFRSGVRGLASIDAPRGTLIGYSTAPGDVAADGEGANSPYTAALAETIKRPGLVAEEMFRRVRVSVLDATGGRQVPWESSSLTGAFYFRPPAPETKAADAGGATPNPGRLELAFWESIKDSDDAGAFEAYLRRFPGGTFTELARLRLDDLEDAPAAGGESSRESPEFQVAALDSVLFTQQRANVRALPKVDAERVATLEPGTEVEVTGRVRDRDWYRIRVDGTRTAFIWAPLLGDTEPAPARPRPAPSPAPDPVPKAAPPAAPARPADVAGRWEGAYRCQDDEIGLALDITRRGGGAVDAVFEFYPLPGTPSFPRGSFTMSGRYDPGDGSLRLRGERWIERPLGLQRHDLDGRVEPTGLAIQGRVLTSGCTHFTVRRR